MKKILVTGATGQIGSELVPALRRGYGAANVIAAGHRTMPSRELHESGPYVSLDVRDKTALETIINRYHIDTIYHLAALLSATAETRHLEAWDININGLINVLESARLHGCSVFHPSSIGVFGPGTPHENTPQETIQRPNTIYGIAKLSGELLCDYYFSKYGVDTRGVRFPGLISHTTPPGGGTTDYAVDIFYAALREKKYTCFLRPGTRLDMMYMPDALWAAIKIMESDPAGLLHRNAYNVASMSFAPEDLEAAIRTHIPEFTMDYQVDQARQAIADSWPDRMDDSEARAQWDWSPEYDLKRMTSDMLTKLAQKLG